MAKLTQLLGAATVPTPPPPAKDTNDTKMAEMQATIDKVEKKIRFWNEQSFISLEQIDWSGSIVAAENSRIGEQTRSGSRNISFL